MALGAMWFVAAVGGASTVRGPKTLNMAFVNPYESARELCVARVWRLKTSACA